MNTRRIVLGGIAGGVALFVYEALLHNLVLGARYELLQGAGILKKEPRVPFYMGAMALVDLAVGIGLAWLYAATRSRLGPGPSTAVRVGLLAGLLSGVPSFLANFAWAEVGGFVSLGWSLDPIVGFTLATLVAGWLYRE
jgi:hypothetical protein